MDYKNMNYKDILAKTPEEIYREFVERCNNNASTATLEASRSLSGAIREAEEDANYHEINLMAVGEGDVDQNMANEYITEYGNTHVNPYDIISEQYNIAKNAKHKLEEYQNKFYELYAKDCLDFVKDFPAKKDNESKEDYLKRVNEIASKIETIQEKANSAVNAYANIEQLYDEGYDWDSSSDYHRYKRSLDYQYNRLAELPYNDMKTALKVSEACKNWQLQRQGQTTFGN